LTNIIIFAILIIIIIMSPEEIAISALAGMERSVTTTTNNDVFGRGDALDSSTTATPSNKAEDENRTESATTKVTESVAVDSSVLVASVDANSTMTATSSASSPLEMNDSAYCLIPDGSSSHANNNDSSNSIENTSKPKRRGPKPKIKLPVEPRLIQSIPKRKEYANHTYSDYSIVPMDPGYVIPTNISAMKFVEKIHDILSKVEYVPWISWMSHGRAFGIIVPAMFEKVVCEKYFGHKRYSSFLRQINNHGFKHLTRDGPDRNCYYHEVTLLQSILFSLVFRNLLTFANAYFYSKRRTMFAQLVIFKRHDAFM
jgi:HSF-type DNA-binding